MADKLNKDYGNARIASPKSNLTRFEPDGDHYNSVAKLRTTRFGTVYNNYGPEAADDATKPEKKNG